MAGKRGFYEVLEISETANEDEIKRAYKKLALDPEATVRFQQINEAYTVLSDPQKRENYDRTGDAELEEGIDFNDILASVFGQAMGMGMGMGGMGMGMGGIPMNMFFNFPDDEDYEEGDSDDEGGMPPGFGFGLSQEQLIAMMLAGGFDDDEDDSEDEEKREKRRQKRAKAKARKKAQKAAAKAGETAGTTDPASSNTVPIETTTEKPSTTTTTPEASSQPTTNTEEKPTQSASAKKKAKKKAKAKAKKAAAKKDEDDSEEDNSDAWEDDDADDWEELPEEIIHEYMLDHIEKKGKAYECTVCHAGASSIPTMRAHFEKKHIKDAEKWAMSPEGAALLDEMQGGDAGMEQMFAMLSSLGMDPMMMAAAMNGGMGIPGMPGMGSKPKATSARKGKGRK